MKLLYWILDRSLGTYLALSFLLIGIAIVHGQSYDVSNEVQMFLDVSISKTQTTGIVIASPQRNGSNHSFSTTTGGVLRFRQGSRIEDVYYTSATIGSDNKVTLVGVTRNLCPGEPTGILSCGDGQQFSRGAIVELTVDARLLNLKANVDRANTFTANQTIKNGNYWYFGNTSAYVYTTNSGTDLRFKDGNNTETTLSTLTAAAGTDTKVSATNTDGTGGLLNQELIVGDGVELIAKNGGATDEFLRISVEGMYGSGSSTLTINSGAVTVGSGSFYDINDDGGINHLYLINGGKNGKIIYIRPGATSITLVEEDEDTGGNIEFEAIFPGSSSNDRYLYLEGDTDPPYIPLRYDGSNWYVMDASTLREAGETMIWFDTSNPSDYWTLADGGEVSIETHRPLWDLYGVTFGSGTSVATLEVADTSTEVLTETGHSLANGDAIIMNKVGGAMPGGLSAYQAYYVCDKTTNTFTLRNVQRCDATPVDITGYQVTVNYATTFTLPDMRGRFPLGRDNMGGASANRVTETAADTIGTGSGAESIDLSHRHESDATTSINLAGGGGNGFGYAASDDPAGPELRDLDTVNILPPYLTVEFYIHR